MLGNITCGLLVLFLDVILGVALLALLVLTRVPFASLGIVWVSGAIKWIFLEFFTCVMTEWKPNAALQRLVAVLCLMEPVVQSGRTLRDANNRPHPDLTLVVMTPLSAALACVAWEVLLRRKTRQDDHVGKDGRRLLSRLLRYFKADTMYLIAAFIFLVFGVVCDSYIPLYQGDVIDSLRHPELCSGFASTLGKLVLISIGSATFSGARGGVFMVTLGRLNKRLKRLLFQRLLQQEAQFFQDNNPGRLAARLHSDVDRMGRTVALNANAAVRSSIKLCLMLKVMMGMSWKLTALTYVEMPLLAAVQSQYAKISRELKDQIQDCEALTRDLASQTLSGIQTVRSFRVEKDELRRYRRAVEQMGAIRRRSGIYKAVFLIIRRIISLGIKLLMLVQARSLIGSGQLSIGSLVSIFLYQKPMSGSVKELLYCYGETVSTMGVIAKVFGYLDRTPSCRPEGQLAPAMLDGRIVFQDVSFSYASSPDKPALKSVSVELRAGKMTALVGPSGSGKTSLVNLLKRLYEPQDGQILLDGEPLHQYTLKYLQQKVALVSQNPELFSGSRRYNIEYGLKNCSAEAAMETVRKINALDLVSDLEDQDDSDVGERGAKLAESQKQSIAIARALVRNPKVLILDEATSKLDVEAQHAVLQEVLASGRTVLVVTHQLKMAEKADHIVFLEHGVVVEEGTHLQLMTSRGRYYHLKEQLFTQSS